MFRRRENVEDERFEEALERVTDGEWPVDLGRSEAEEELGVARLLHQELSALRTPPPGIKERALVATRIRAAATPPKRGLFEGLSETFTGVVMSRQVRGTLVAVVGLAVLSIVVSQVLSISAEPVGEALRLARALVVQEVSSVDGASTVRLAWPTTVTVEVPQGWRAFGTALVEAERYRVLTGTLSSWLGSSLPGFLPWNG